MDNDVIFMMERSISRKIMNALGTNGIVYDVIAIRYYVSENALEKYGHHYTANSGKFQMFFSFFFS